MKDFKEKVAIYTSEKKMSDIVVDASALPTEIASKGKKGCIIKATEYPKNDVLKYCEDLFGLTWSPQLDELQDGKRNPPESLMLFCKHPLQSKSTLNKTNPEYVQILSNSFASDIIAAISQGKTIITKQFLLALGLRNITGQRKVVETVNILGQYLTCNTTCEADKAFAVKGQHLLSNSFLPLRPINEYDYALTVFWVDNFNIKVEKLTGSTFVNITHMIAFQERGEINRQENKGTPLPQSRKQKLENETNKNQDKEIFVNSKIEPPISTGEFSGPTEEHIHKILLRYFLWLWIRKENSFDQQNPMFSGKGFCFSFSHTLKKIHKGNLFEKKKQVSESFY